MARALECPACGAQHRIESLPDSPTFRCDRCGQVLKVSAPVSSTAGAPAPPARTGDVTAAAPAAPVAPPPRLRTPGHDAPVNNAMGVSATVAAVAADDDASGRRGRKQGTPSSTRPRATKSKVSWYWRLLAWVVAVPVGFVITAWPAYELGLIKKDDVLDIFVGTGSGRYVRLAIGTAIWALVTALLVQLFIEGGRAWKARRRRSRAVTA